MALYTIRGERAGKQQLNDNQVQIFTSATAKRPRCGLRQLTCIRLDEFFS